MCGEEGGREGWLWGGREEQSEWREESRSELWQSLSVPVPWAGASM